MPPPLAPLVARPSRTVSPDRLTVRFVAMLQTRLLGLPLMARFVAPGPEMTRLLLIINSPLVSGIVAGIDTEKTMVSPLLALARACRNVPAPLSELFVTVMV